MLQKMKYFGDRKPGSWTKKLYEKEGEKGLVGGGLKI